MMIADCGFKTMKTGAKLIARERDRQKAVEGWTDEHDDGHAQGEMALAGIVYAIASVRLQRGQKVDTEWRSSLWPWEEKWFKPAPDPIRNLEKAGALFAAAKRCKPPVKK